MIGKEQKALEQKEREGRVHRMKSALQYKKKEKTGVMKQVYDRLDHMQVRNYLLNSKRTTCVSLTSRTMFRNSTRI